MSGGLKLQKNMTKKLLSAGLRVCLAVLLMMGPEARAFAAPGIGVRPGLSRPFPVSPAFTNQAIIAPLVGGRFLSGAFRFVPTFSFGHMVRMLRNRRLATPSRTLAIVVVGVAALAFALSYHHAAMHLPLEHAVQGVLAAVALLAPLSAAWNIPDTLPDDYSWAKVLWGGLYGERLFSRRYGLPLTDESVPEPTISTVEVPASYPHLQTPDEEIQYLLDYLIAHDTEPRRSALEKMKADLPQDLTNDDKSRLIGRLRWTVMDLDIRDPEKLSEWSQALKIIGKRLETLRRRPGDGAWVYGQVMQKLEEIAAALPFVDDHPATEEKPGTLDNLRSFILNVPHGLAHSLDILEDLMVVDDQSFADAEERRYAKQVHIGAAIFHDLTSLRDRYRHHETARDLVVSVLDPLLLPDGSARYSRRLINDTALVCQNHRGQEYPPPQSMIDQIFMEVDEYNLIKNLQRVMDQPGNGFFQPDFLDVYRDISFLERRRQAGGTPFKHETPQADYTQYLLMTQFIRTDPRVYKNPIVRQWVSDSYPAIKNRILRLAKTNIFEEVMGKDAAVIDTRKLFEVKNRIHRFKGLVRELEVLYRYDRDAKARIRKEVGAPAVLAGRIQILENRMDQELAEPLPNGPIANAFYLLRALSSHRQETKKGGRLRRKVAASEFPESSLADSASAQAVFPDFSFRVGRAVADLYLENPFASLPDLLEKLSRQGFPLIRSDPKNLSRSLLFLLNPGSVALREKPDFQNVHPDYAYAGLAYGLSQINAYRVRRLYEMVAFNAQERLEMKSKDQELGSTLALAFLHRVGRGQPMMEVLRSLRHEMDSLRYGPTRPETWDAADYPSIESLLSWILRTIKGQAHTHLGGIPWVHQSAAILKNEPRLIGAFRTLVGKEHDLDPRDPAELRRLLYEQSGIGSGPSFERAFIPAHAILNFDRNGRYHDQFLRQAVLDSAEQGTRFIGVISSFGQEQRSPDEFREVIEAALEGMLAGEREANRGPGPPVRGALLLGLRKTASPEKAVSLVQQWVGLRERFMVSHPEFARRIFGIDSIGYESGFTYGTHREAFDLARAHGQWLQAHAGERWPEEPIEQALLRLEPFIEGGFHSTVNDNALFADPATFPRRLFSAERKAALAALQERIAESAIRRRVWLQFSPASNEVNSSDSRNREEWGYRRIDEWILKGLRLLVTDDDPGVFETNLPLEFLQLYMGTTAYGPVGIAALKRLLHNSRLFYEQSLRRLDQPLQPGHAPRTRRIRSPRTQAAA